MGQYAARASDTATARERLRSARATRAGGSSSSAMADHDSVNSLHHTPSVRGHTPLRETPLASFARLARVP
eukprot:7249334-Prymnesium_polylepis.1